MVKIEEIRQSLGFEKIIEDQNHPLIQGHFCLEKNFPFNELFYDTGNFYFEINVFFKGKRKYDEGNREILISYGAKELEWDKKRRIMKVGVFSTSLQEMGLKKQSFVNFYS